MQQSVSICWLTCGSIHVRDSSDSIGDVIGEIEPVLDVMLAIFDVCNDCTLQRQEINKTDVQNLNSEITFTS